MTEWQLRLTLLRNRLSWGRPSDSTADELRWLLNELDRDGPFAATFETALNLAQEQPSDCAAARYTLLNAVHNLPISIRSLATWDAEWFWRNELPCILGECELEHGKRLIEALGEDLRRQRKS